MNAEKSENREIRSEARLSLAEERSSSRVLGCVGVSTIAHLAMLVALAIVPISVRELVTGSQKSGDGTEVTIVDGGPSKSSPPEIATVVPAVVAPVAQAAPPVTSEDIVELPTKKSPPKIAAKVAVKAPPKAVILPKKTVVAKTIESTPEQTAEESVVEKAISEEESNATAAAATPVIADDAPEQIDSDSKLRSKAEPEAVAEAEEETVPVATAKIAPKNQPENQAEKQPETQSEKQIVAAATDTAATTGSGGSDKMSMSSGPIRDASELKALGGNPNPVYPARDRLARKQGTAVLLGRVSNDGRVTDVQIEQSSGSQQMDAASLQAFKSWRFQAGQEGWVRKPFQFRLVGDAQEVPARLGNGLKR